MNQPNLVIRRASPGDAAALTEIAVKAKRHWGYPNRWISRWRPALTITSEIINSMDVWAGLLDGEIVGFYALRFSSDLGILEHLWVLPASIHEGHGSALFQHAAGRCRAQGCLTLQIESDPNAQGFYEKMGARRVGDRIGEVDGQSRRLPVLELQL